MGLSESGSFSFWTMRSQDVLFKTNIPAEVRSVSRRLPAGCLQAASRIAALYYRPTVLTLGGATIFAKLRSKIAKSPKIGGKVCAHHFV